MNTNNKININSKKDMLVMNIDTAITPLTLYIIPQKDFKKLTKHYTLNDYYDMDKAEAIAIITKIFPKYKPHHTNSAITTFLNQYPQIDGFKNIDILMTN